MEPPRSDLNTIRRKKMIEKIENEHFIVEVNSLGAQLNMFFSRSLVGFMKENMNTIFMSMK